MIERRNLTLENLLERRRRGGIEHGLRYAHHPRRLIRWTAGLLARCAIEGIRSLWSSRSRKTFRFHTAEIAGIVEGLRARQRIERTEAQRDPYCFS